MVVGMADARLGGPVEDQTTVALGQSETRGHRFLSDGCLYR